jgi:ribosomal protein L29
MKIAELREKTDNELQRLLSELRNQVREFRFKVASREQSRVRDVRGAKKTIAQVLTLLRSRKDSSAKAKTA